MNTWTVISKHDATSTNKQINRDKKTDRERERATHSIACSNANQIHIRIRFITRDSNIHTDIYVFYNTFNKINPSCFRVWVFAFTVRTLCVVHRARLCAAHHTPLPTCVLVSMQNHFMPFIHKLRVCTVQMEFNRFYLHVN